MKGVVKFFNKEKGYGFITPEGETKDVYVHFTGIKGEDGFKSLEKGQTVVFDTNVSQRGLSACNVEVVQ